MEKKEIQAITERKGTKLVAIASTEDQDRVGDVIRVKDWDFSNFLNNPVLQAGHDYRPQFTVGVAKNVRVEGKSVTFEPVFHTITPLAKQIKEMYEQGFLKAWSVGFIPADGEVREKHELLEVSAVAVPANAHALMKSMKAMDNGTEEKVALELKEWKEKVLAGDEDDVEEPVEEAGEDDDLAVADDTAELSEEDESPDFDVEEKSMMQSKTGEENDHVHMASYDNETGNGSTDEVNGHAHKIKDFTVLEADGHTHTLEKEPTDDTDQAGMYGKKKPKKKKGLQIKTAWNKNLPNVFHKDFDVTEVESATRLFEHEIFTKFFDVEIKNVYQNSYFVPSPLVGTYLAAFDEAVKGFDLVDTRSWTYDGNEYPPAYEVIQLNSAEKRDFLVMGTKFYREGEKNKIAVKFSPSWGGLTVTLITGANDKEFNKGVLEKAHAWARDNNFLRGEKFALSGSFIQKGTRSWDDVLVNKGIADGVRRSLKVLEDVDKKKSRGLLFVGPPGTGKTLTGKTIVDNVDSTFIWISSQDMFDAGPIGAMKLAFDLARDLAPTVLFMEDIDAWVKYGMVDMLKTQLDGIQENRGVVTVLTSNHPEELPDALLDRPGRFHEILVFDLPDADVRSLMLLRWVDGIDQATLNNVVKATKGFSGSHMRELVDYALVVAADEDIAVKDALAKSLEKLLNQRELIQQIRQRRKSVDIIDINVKEGRVLSKKNKTIIEQARDALTEVLKIEETRNSEDEVVETPKKQVVEAVQKGGNHTSDQIAVRALQQIVSLSNKTLNKTKLKKHPHSKTKI